MKKLYDRYLNDPSFTVVTDLLVNLIKSEGYTPMELRQAIFFAQYKYERENPHPLFYRSKEIPDLPEKA